jgi:ABC-2 type transport system ATP-binding protein
MPDAAIEVTGLSKRYGGQAVVDDVSFSVRSGAVTGFLGPNGAGKTTTLRCLLGLARPSGGSATVRGRPYAELDDPVRTVGANLEISGAHPGRSGRQHLRSLAAMAELPDERVDQVLEQVEMTESADRRYGKYSMGMRQRLGLAVTLLGEPEILVLDEPANGLDPAGIRWLRTLLRSTAEEGRTVLVSSHVLAEVAQTVDDVVVINRGRIVKQGHVSELTGAAAKGATIVRSPEADKLAEAARGKGAAVQVYDDGALGIEGLDAPAVGDLAFEVDIPLHQLYQAQASLEDVFFQLTAEAGE